MPLQQPPGVCEETTDILQLLDEWCDNVVSEANCLSCKYAPDHCFLEQITGFGSAWAEMATARGTSGAPA